MLSKNACFINNKCMKTVLLLFIILMSLITCTGCALVPKEEVVIAPPTLKAPTITYDYSEVKIGTIEQTETCIGYFTSVSNSDLSFKNQDGRLKNVYVKPGDKVEKGDLLAELYTNNLKNQIKQQEIVLAKDRLSLDAAKLNGQKDIDVLKKQIDNMKNKLKKMLLIQDTYSKEEIDNLKESIDEQEITYSNKVAINKDSIATAECDVELCQLQLDSLRQNLNDARLLSPIDGLVSYVTDAKEGEYINSFKTIVRVDDPGNLQIQCKGDNIDKFILGAKVSIAYNNETLSGKVAVTPAQMPVDASEDMKASIIIKLDKLPKKMVAGDSVDVKYVLDKRDNVIALPIDYLHNDGIRNFVYILQNGIRKERVVETGLRTITQVEIKSGLSVGDKVITD